MKVYIVTEYEAHEGGEHRSIDSVWLSQEQADERAREVNAGRYVSRDVTEMEISDGDSSVKDRAMELPAELSEILLKENAALKAGMLGLRLEHSAVLIAEQSMTSTVAALTRIAAA